MSKEKDFVIYKTINLINGKIYAGQDSNNNPRYIGSGERYFQNALKKYGRKNFKKEILEHCRDMNELNDREIFWIKELDATNPKIGYNIAKGGKGHIGVPAWNKGKKGLQVAWNKGKKGCFSKESLKKMSESQKRKIISEETRQKMSKLKKGQIPWNKGIPCSKETKQKISERNKGKHHSKKTKRKMSELKKGSIPWIKDKHHSDATKQKISKSNKGKKSWNKGKYKYNISKKELYNLYIIQNKSQRKITKHFNCSRIVISNRLKKYNIKNRNI